MHHVPLLDELAVIAVLAVVVTVLLARLHLPTVAGLLAAGALGGPFGLGLVHSVRAIEVLAEVGVVLLLFTIGLEFSLARLRDIFREVAVGGALQVGLTIAVTVVVAMIFGQPFGRALFYGFVFSLSSTAIVLRALGERRELDAPHGRFIVGTLIFQDLCVIPMVLIVPLLGSPGHPMGAALDLGKAIGKAVLVVVLTVALSRVVVPRVLSWVDSSRSREVFLLAILALCIGTAWLTSLAGLSLALGAFLGGMVVADTEYGHRAMGDMLPLRDVFVSIFFVSLGMLFDVRIVAARPILVLGLLLGFLMVKGLLAALSATAMRFPARAAWLAGVGLAQFGEFGFVLARLGESTGLVGAEATRPLLAAGILSMFATPLLVRGAPHLRAGERLLAPLERIIGVRSIDEADEGHDPLEGHVVIVGFGVAGRAASRALAASDVLHLVLDMNAQSVREAKAKGFPVYYGDATSEEALGHANIKGARALVLLMNDPAGAVRIVDTVKRIAPHVPVFMRTRYLAEREALVATGAHDVVAEEVEGAAEIVARLLRSMEVPRNAIDERIRELRAETQPSQRRRSLPRPALADVRGLDELKIETVRVRPGSPAVGASLATMQLRSKTGALVVGMRRGATLIEMTDPTLAFEIEDTVYLAGTKPAIRRALLCFDEESDGAPPARPSHA